MKKQKLTEGIVDKIYKLLSLGKYAQVQKNFKDSKEVQNAIKKSEETRKKLIKSIEKFEKSHGKSKDTFRSNLFKKYGRP